MQKATIVTIMGYFFLILVTTFVAGGDIMTVEADIIDSQGTSGNQSGAISIQVPDFIDLGNVSEAGVSQELQIYMNNTGTGEISVTPLLINYTDEIFQNLYFREFKTSGGNPVTPVKIGSWSFNVSAPASGSQVRSKYFYMQLDLRNSGLGLTSNVIGHRAQVRFFATAR